MSIKPEIVLTATDKTKAAFDSVDKSLKGLGGSAAKATAAFAAIGSAFLIKGVIDNTIQAENAMKQLENRVRSTGMAAGYNATQLSEMALSLQDVTTFGDEAVMEMQALLLTFTKIQGPVFKGAQEAILNVATAMAGDGGEINLKGAALQVGKALNDPIKGIASLSKAGIQFSADQKATIKALVDTGNTAGAQALILKELEVQFGGTARAARDTFGGAIKGLKNAFGELLEANGVSGVTNELNELTKILQDPQTRAAAKTLTSAIVTGFTEAVKAISTAVNFVQGFGEALAKFVGGSADPLERVNDQIKEINGELKQNYYMMQHSVIGSDGYKNIEKSTDALERQLEVLFKQKKGIMEMASAPAVVAPKASIETPTEAIAGISTKPDNIPGGALTQEQIDAELQKISDYNLSKYELQLVDYQRQTEFVAENVANEEERQRYMEYLAKHHEDELTKISTEGMTDRQKFQAMVSKEQVKTVLGDLAALSAGSADSNKKMFKLNKAAAISNAVIGAYEGAAKSLATYPMPLAAAMAALHVAAGLANVQKIKSQQFGGGGGGAGSMGAGVPSMSLPEMPKAAADKESSGDKGSASINVTVNGNLIGVERFNEVLADAIKQGSDRDNLTINSSSGRIV